MAYKATESALLILTKHTHWQCRKCFYDWCVRACVLRFLITKQVYFSFLYMLVFCDTSTILVVFVMTTGIKKKEKKY